MVTDIADKLALFGMVDLQTVDLVELTFGAYGPGELVADIAVPLDTTALSKAPVGLVYLIVISRVGIHVPVVELAVKARPPALCNQTRGGDVAGGLAGGRRVQGAKGIGASGGTYQSLGDLLGRIPGG